MYSGWRHAAHNAWGGLKGGTPEATAYEEKASSENVKVQAPSTDRLYLNELLMRGEDAKKLEKGSRQLCGIGTIDLGASGVWSTGGGGGHQKF